MVTVNILNKKRPREIRTFKFLITNLFTTIGFPVLLTIITITFFSPKSVIYFIQSHTKINVTALPNFIKFFLLTIVFYTLIKTIFITFFSDELLATNYYYLVPSWLIKLTSRIGYAHKANAASIPTWQYIEYLYYRWAKIDFQIPDISDADSSFSLKICEQKNIDTTCLALIISDTYPINLNELPQDIKTHNYVFFQTIVNNKLNKGRRAYNQKLVQEITDQINWAKQADVSTIKILANTSPKHIEEIMRESFNDAGRSNIEHLYVFENPRENDFKFKKEHKIF